MRTTRIYIDANLDGDSVELPRARLHYLRKVLRLTDGAAVRVFDGRGMERMAALNGTTVVLGKSVTALPAPSVAITLLQGISRGERMDLTLQKATELGVSELVPVFCERGEVKLTATRSERKNAHWQGVIASACEQCGRADLPKLHSAIALSKWIGQHPESLDQRLFLSPASRTGLSSVTGTGRVTIAVGPEGGFCDNEEQNLAAAGFVAVNLGLRVLRTETAGPAAIVAIQTLWGDFAKTS